MTPLEAPGSRKVEISRLVSSPIPAELCRSESVLQRPPNPQPRRLRLLEVAFPAPRGPWVWMGPLEGQPRPWDAPGCCGFAQAQEPSDAAPRGEGMVMLQPRGARGSGHRARAGRGHPAGKQGQPGPCSGEDWSQVRGLAAGGRNSLCVTPLLYPDVGGVGRRSARPGSRGPPHGCLSLARTPDRWRLVGVWFVMRPAQPLARG